MPTFKNKPCDICEKYFSPKGPASKYCESCAEDKRKEGSRAKTQRYRIAHGLVQKPGVGKGGNNAKGSEDSQYKTGIAYFQNNRRQIKEDRRYCEECGKDLKEVGSYDWVIHHINHDRSVNVDSNFQLLCKRCHQLEHDCASNFNV